MENGSTERALNFPNTLTVIRIILIPVFLWLLYQHSYRYALVVFFVSAVTDLLDGHLARSWHEETQLGKILDPIADKLILVSSFVLCAWLGLVPWWLSVLVVGRDIIVVSGIAVLYSMYREVFVDPTMMGKTAIAFEFALLCYVLLNVNYGVVPDLAMPMFVVTAALSVISGILYVKEGIDIAARKQKGS